MWLHELSIDKPLLYKMYTRADLFIKIFDITQLHELDQISKHVLA